MSARKFLQLLTLHFKAAETDTAEKNCEHSTDMSPPGKQFIYTVHLEDPEQHEHSL